jgi:RimJ/RimL family protein N-acetyltransferase
MADESPCDLERGIACMLAIRKRDTEQFVGTVSLGLPALEPDSWTADTMGILGYAVGRRYQGKGFATEAATALVHCAFVDIGLERLRATSCATTFHREESSSASDSA